MTHNLDLLMVVKYSALNGLEAKKTFNFKINYSFISFRADMGQLIFAVTQTQQLYS